METQNAVPWGDVFALSETIRGILRSSRRCAVIARQISPRPCVAMKFTTSGVIFSAATMRSPSFSRSSSSTMMTFLPSWISSSASSIDAHAMSTSVQHPFDVLRDHVELQVHGVARPGMPQIRILERVRNNRNLQFKRPQCRYCQADAVNSNGSLLNDVA